MADLNRDELVEIVTREVLSALAQVVAFISWFAIVFTGRLPEGLAKLQCMVIRYSMRTYAYAGFLHASYPPFEFSSSPDDPGGTPVTVAVPPRVTKFTESDCDASPTRWRTNCAGAAAMFSVAAGTAATRETRGTSAASKSAPVKLGPTVTLLLNSSPNE